MSQGWLLALLRPWWLIKQIKSLLWCGEKWDETRYSLLEELKCSVNKGQTWTQELIKIGNFKILIIECWSNLKKVYFYFNLRLLLITKRVHVSFILSWNVHSWNVSLFKTNTHNFPPTLSVYAQYHLIFCSHRNLDPNKGSFNQIGRALGCFDWDHTIYDLREGTSWLTEPEQSWLLECHMN